MSEQKEEKKPEPLVDDEDIVDMDELSEDDLDDVFEGESITADTEDKPQDSEK